MNNSSRPRPLIEEIATLSGLKLNSKHWSKGSTVTTDYFREIYEILVGKPYSGKKDKRSIAEALLKQISEKQANKNIIEENMFSTGSTVTNKYFEALLNALIELKKIEQNGFKYSENTDRQSELEYIINDFPDGSLEGAKLLVTHYIYERDKRLSLCAKRIARECHPEKLLECEICGIIPEKEYKLDLIQADHRTPLNQLNKQTNVMPKDFAMLCPNCHRAVHKTENCEIFEVVRKLNDLKL